MEPSCSAVDAAGTGDASRHSRRPDVLLGGLLIRNVSGPTQISTVEIRLSLGIVRVGWR